MSNNGISWAICKTAPCSRQMINVKINVQINVTEMQCKNSSRGGKVTEFQEVTGWRDLGVYRSQVVQCLSSMVHSDMLMDNRHRVSVTCRQQLKFELLQRVGSFFCFRFGIIK